MLCISYHKKIFFKCATLLNHKENPRGRNLREIGGQGAVLETKGAQLWVPFPAPHPKYPCPIPCLQPKAVGQNSFFIFFEKKNSS